MDLRVVVARLEAAGGETGRGRQFELAALAGHGGRPPAGGIARLRETQGANVRKTGLAHVVAHPGNQLGVQQRGLALLDQDAAVGQRAMAVGHERRAKQAFSRADRVSGVDDDQVQAAFRQVLDMGQPVVKLELGARVIVALAQLGEEAFSQTGHFLIDLDLGAMLDLGMSQHFFQRAAVAAADDQHPLWCGMREQCRVRQHLVVEEVVARGQHDKTIDHHQVAPVAAAIDIDGLEVALGMGQVFLDHQRPGRTGILVFLGKPFVAV